MLQYLVILLDDTSVSYCHYDNLRKEHKLIPLDILKAGIRYAMKENLMIQFVWSDYELPNEYKETVYTIDHVNIVPISLTDTADVIVIEDMSDLKSRSASFSLEQTYVLRVSKVDLFEDYRLVSDVLKNVNRLNVVITDIETFTDDDFKLYSEVLKSLAKTVKDLYSDNHKVQLNLLTDRLMLDKMNNCNAGYENITLAPDGKFYVCPAFYLHRNSYDIGDLQSELDIKNPQLYKLEYAPICRKCDAYHCRRCVWLNGKTTLEVNTPGHEQCVAAHIERNASRDLKTMFEADGLQFINNSIDIPEIGYLDPFEKMNKL